MTPDLEMPARCMHALLVLPSVESRWSQHRFLPIFLVFQNF